MQLFQEKLKESPFWMLVACQLVNKTRWSVAEKALDQIRRDFPTPWHLANANWWMLEPTLRPLGLSNRRSRLLIAFANAWSIGIPVTRQHVMEMPGCSDYAADSWAIFVQGRTDVEPRDEKLSYYVFERLHPRSDAVVSSEGE